MAVRYRKPGLYRMLSHDTAFTNISPAQKKLACSYLCKALAARALEKICGLSMRSTDRYPLPSVRHDADATDIACSIPWQALDNISSAVINMAEGSGDIVGEVCRSLDMLASYAYGNRARDAGAFYTPMHIARFICSRTIGAYLLHYLAVRSGKRFSAIDDAIAACSLDELYSLYFGALKGIKVLDSSCGSGIFLEASLEELYRLRMSVLSNVKQRFPREKVPAFDAFLAETGEDGNVSHHILRSIVADNIYGADIDRFSLEVAATRLMLRTASAQDTASTLNGLKINLVSGNAIMPFTGNVDCEELRPIDWSESFPGTGGMFDVIVGNPPYMRVKSMFSAEDSVDRVKKKNELSRIFLSGDLYHYQEGNLNLYKLFIERNLGLLHDGGGMGLIFPSSFLTESTSRRLRKYIFSTCTIDDIIEVPERSCAFDRINQATAILICHKSRHGSDHFRLRIGARTEDLGEDMGGSILIGYDELEEITGGRMEVPLLTCPDIEWDMIKHLRNIPAFKGDEGIPPIGTITVGHIDETINRPYISETPTGDIFVKGIHLKEYHVDLSPDGEQPRWVRKDAFLKIRPSAALTISRQRIIGRNTLNKACSRRLKFALLPPGYLCGNSVKQIVITDPCINPLYLLALLNSALLNWYFELFCSQNNIRNYSIESLPIPRAPYSIQATFAAVSQLIMESGGETREFLDKRLMDAMVYELYMARPPETGLIALAGPHVDNNRDAEALIRDPSILRKIEEIECQPGFKLISMVAYRQANKAKY